MRVRKALFAVSVSSAMLAAGSPATAVAAPSTRTTTTAVAKPSLSPSVKTAKAGAKVAFSGRTTAKSRVTIQYLRGRTWRNAATTTASSSGRFTATVKHPGGRVAYRAVAAKNGGSATGVTVYVNAPAAPAVLRTYKLADYADSHHAREAMSFGGVGHGAVIALEGGEDSISWTLKGCTQFTGIAGASDNGRDEVDYHLNVMVDGANRFHEMKRKGAPGTPVTVSLRGARVLALSSSSEWGYDRGFGDATVTCAAPPSLR